MQDEPIVRLERHPMPVHGLLGALPGRTADVPDPLLGATGLFEFLQTRKHP
jgi:hypothetical protein